MHVIKDIEGNDWHLALKLKHARMIEGRTGISMLDPESAGEAGMKIILSAATKLELLWMLCEEEAKNRGIGREKFEELIYDSDSATSIEDIMEALNKEIIFFIQKFDRTQGEIWSALSRKLKVLSTAQVKGIKQALEDPELDKAIQEASDRTCKDAVTTLRETLGKAFTSAQG